MLRRETYLVLVKCPGRPQQLLYTARWKAGSQACLQAGMQAGRTEWMRIRKKKKQQKQQKHRLPAKTEYVDIHNPRKTHKMSEYGEAVHPLCLLCWRCSGQGDHDSRYPSINSTPAQETSKTHASFHYSSKKKKK